MGRLEELRSAGRLAGDALAGVVGIVEDMHGAVASRVDAALPPVAAPVTSVQRGITNAVYAGVTAGHRLLAAGGAELIARQGDATTAAPSETARGRQAAAIVNGLWGDRVAQNHPEVAIPMAVRVDGRDVALTPDALAEAFPAATRRLVVFVHGLVQDESAWQVTPGGASEQLSRSYGDLLHDELGHTPIYVRYNTGLRVSANGQSLSALLADLLDAWPVPVEEVNLVGASMGGLVARSACHYGDRHDEQWARLVRTVVTLGTPHLGAPLERGAHVVDWVLRRFAETEPLSRVLGSRSVGVRDLRYGNLVEEDWFGHDPDELLTDRATHVPFLEHATYYFVAATVTSDALHPAGRLLGDGLVRYSSASGSGTTRRIPFDHANGVHLTGVHHLSMLTHPAVYAHLRKWLAHEE